MCSVQDVPAYDGVEDRVIRVSQEPGLQTDIHDVILRTRIQNVASLTHVVVIPEDDVPGGPIPVFDPQFGQSRAERDKLGSNRAIRRLERREVERLRQEMCSYQLRIYEMITNQAKTHPVRGQHRVLRAAEPHECTNRSYEIQKLHHGPHPPGVGPGLRSQVQIHKSRCRQAQVGSLAVSRRRCRCRCRGRSSESVAGTSKSERANFKFNNGTAHTHPSLSPVFMQISAPCHHLESVCSAPRTSIRSFPHANSWELVDSIERPWLINVAEILGANCSASDHHVNASFPAISGPSDER